MIETHLNLFDAAVIGIMALSCLFAFFRGLIREILSLIAWIGAGVVTVHYFPAVAEKLQDHFKTSATADAVAIITLYLGSLIGFALINMIIVKTIRQSEEAGTLDNVLGLVFGAFRGAFIISLAFFAIMLALPQKNYPQWITQSVTRPYAERGAEVLAKMAPDYLQRHFRQGLEPYIEQAPAAGGEHAPASSQTGYEAQPPASQGGYSRDAARQLDRVIESQ